MRQVVFSACQPHEVAYEHAGQGDFTRHALDVLRGGTGGLDNDDFQQRVTDAFGPVPCQRPMLDCAPVARQRPFLAPLTPHSSPEPSGAEAISPQPGADTPRVQGLDIEALVRLMQAVRQELRDRLAL